MENIIDSIMGQLESDPTIHGETLNLVVTARGFLRRRQVLNVFGTTESAAEKDKVLGIVRRQAGDSYDVEDKTVVLEAPNQPAVTRNRLEA